MLVDQISIRGLRLMNEDTQEALAQKLGVATYTIRKWETNQVELKPLHIFAIAYVYKVDADILKV